MTCTDCCLGRTSFVCLSTWLGAGQDAFLMESLFRNEVWGHLQAPVSEPNETSVFSSMIDGCRCDTHALCATKLS